MVLIEIRNCLNEDVGAVGVVESSSSCSSGDLQPAVQDCRLLLVLLSGRLGRRRTTED